MSRLRGKPGRVGRKRPSPPVEGAVQMEQARLAAAVNVARLGFFELHGDFAQVSFDDRLRALLGLSKSDALRAAKVWQERVHPGDRARVIRLMQEAMVGLRESVSFEYRYRHPRRGLIWLHQLFRVLERDRDGTVVKALGAIQEVTVRKRALQLLAQSERSFRATFEQAPVGVAHVAPDGHFLRVNRSFCDFVGHSREELQHTTLADVTHQTDLAADAEQIRRIVEGEIETWSGERRYVRRSGEPIWGHLTVSLVRDRDGKPEWFVVIVQDVTARRNAEEELSRLHGQLWHADRAAQIGVLSASLAHELNQPLSAILTNAQAGLRFLAMDNPDLEEIRTILQDIAQDDKRAGMVVSGLRAMLRRRATLRERFPLAEALSQVLALLRTEMMARHVHVSLHADPGLMVSADRTQLQQVILNLVMNAVEAMRDAPDDRRRVELTLTRTERGEAQVAVRDHGPGVTADQQVFEAFWTTKESGMGIGLAISRSIVESHGGHMGFTNQPDGGATFHFTLPAELPRNTGKRRSSAPRGRRESGAQKVAD